MKNMDQEDVGQLQGATKQIWATRHPLHHGDMKEDKLHKDTRQSSRSPLTQGKETDTLYTVVWEHFISHQIWRERQWEQKPLSCVLVKGDATTVSRLMHNLSETKSMKKCQKGFTQRIKGIIEIANNLNLSWMSDKFWDEFSKFSWCRWGNLYR